MILDFFSGIEVCAQYAEDGHAIVEWQINSDSYHIEGRNDGSEVTIYFNEPRSRQQFPERYDGCIDTSGVSISIRNVFDREKMFFKLNDPNGVLPAPFPVFETWTRFNEDEIFD